jgi:hypothetical protein
MSNQNDNPAQSAEWTAETVHELMMTQEDDWLAEKVVADAINAALAAERKINIALRNTLVERDADVEKYQRLAAASGKLDYEGGGMSNPAQSAGEWTELRICQELGWERGYPDWRAKEPDFARLIGAINAALAAAYKKGLDKGRMESWPRHNQP